MAEQRTHEIRCIIQPALLSEDKRKSIIGYFQRQIKGYYCIEVFPFGSVPLKIFLPDGDIDMTALSHQNVEENFAKYICSIVEDDQQDSEFLVQDVQYICAQVKIVKCTVNNIPVDISFNQMAGLSALCFLEQVDQLVGKDHLFKRSIILIKAWCYYESRILGAHHGLISTYALETLILYIINIFHSSLHGPLAVLYKFLDYYSTFDWANYCISITGPVSLSSLPAVVAETPENDGDKLLLSHDFLRRCKEIFSVPVQSLEIGAHIFPINHFNIMDPLKENNNLGRSDEIFRIGFEVRENKLRVFSVCDLVIVAVFSGLWCLGQSARGTITGIMSRHFLEDEKDRLQTWLTGCPDGGTGSPLGSMLRIMGPYFPVSFGVGDLRIPTWEFLMRTIWSHGRTCGLGSCSDLLKTSLLLSSSTGRARFNVGSVASKPCDRKSFKSLAEDSDEDVKTNKKNTTVASWWVLQQAKYSTTCMTLMESKKQVQGHRPPNYGVNVMGSKWIIGGGEGWREKWRVGKEGKKEKR
ncbi:hypothetical protein CRYUN_Cryun09bG0128600 [Craigia yunnanensis]